MKKLDKFNVVVDNVLYSYNSVGTWDLLAYDFHNKHIKFGFNIYSMFKIMDDSNLKDCEEFYKIFGKYI